MIYYNNDITENIIADIRSAVRWCEFTNKQLTCAIENTIYSIVAYENCEAIGMGRLIGDGIYHFICDVAIKPSYQGKGIGTAIIHELLNYIKKNLELNQRCSLQLISANGQKFGFLKIPNTNSGHGM